ncbi:heterokaryon incompatibility protein-domain-containing protein [Exophiala viscosa]|uniref:Heterokaryon incompatibility protein-domain-containing protein n=1 Tax=Exophiala viscosa TaxID=2486360 RepID=A0AAN6IFE8_9EURO|nr:heterokaryon incompatibility protein-domain-containing protein [Exophiala viscosa]KAI1624109.1 heterokaryon incompatibility protein-domain-containing protein [Exophiala viscosa]
MRLLYFDARGELSLTRDLIEEVPAYAILSHTWGADEDEVTFSDLQNGNYKSKAGYAKIQFCREQARRDGIEYFWVDSCCVDKSNSTELNEAITSMFRWYGSAARCYVFLSDVSARKCDCGGALRVWESAFRKSRWFTRGWTLQELLAPGSVEFFSREGEPLGDKRSLEQTIHDITTVPREALRDTPPSHFPVPERLRWAKNRNTTRIEDEAYCLLGLFNVFMSPIYGEGENAFVRLKDEIHRSYRRELDGLGQKSVASTSLCPKEDDIKYSSTQAAQTSLQDRRKLLLTSLSFEQMDSRRSTIKNAYSTTCQWLLRHSAYLEWMDPKQLPQHRGFLWLNGKPGAGKSTLIKFAYAHAERVRCENEVLISFFFNARGDELEKSTTGMYRALLYQLMNKAPDLQTIWDDVHTPCEDQNQPPVWTTELLSELLSTAIARLGQRRLTCFVDALDECDEQQFKKWFSFSRK